jgi:hypothetical protein
MVTAALPLAKFGASTMVSAIQAMYKVAGDMNTWANNHIQDMQSSENLTVARTGKVLEGAKLGFGIGYVAPVTVIAVGQFLLGNTLDAAVTVVSAATLTNPFAMTCAAVGAIYFGWNALSNEERNDILDKISAGLQIGIELIKALLGFVIATTRELLNSKNLAEIKEFIRSSATAFGKKLGDVTRAVADRVADAAQSAKTMATSAVDVTADRLNRATIATATSAAKATDRIKKALDTNGDGQLGLDDLRKPGKGSKRAINADKKDPETK